MHRRMRLLNLRLITRSHRPLRVCGVRRQKNGLQLVCWVQVPKRLLLEEVQTDIMYLFVPRLCLKMSVMSAGAKIGHRAPLERRFAAEQNQASKDRRILVP